MYFLLVQVSKNVHTDINTYSVFIRTCERQSYTFPISYTYLPTLRTYRLHTQVMFYTTRAVFLHSIHTHMVWLCIFNHHCMWNLYNIQWNLSIKDT